MKYFAALLISAVLFVACGDESSSSAPAVILDEDLSSSSVAPESSFSSVIPGSDLESGSSKVPDKVGDHVEQSSSATLEVDNGWNVSKESRLNPDITYGTMTDSRDGQTYKTVTIGDQVWMAENLNYADRAKTPSLLKRSWCGGGLNWSEGNCAIFGRLYTWAAAIDSVALYDGGNGVDCGYGMKICMLPAKVQGICPEGWHLPTETEWKTLFDEVGGYSSAGKVLKSQTGWNNNENGSDAVGFAALPAGRRGSVGYFFDNNATFWSATQYSDIYACCMYFDYNGSAARLGRNDENDGFSVRCLKD